MLKKYIENLHKNGSVVLKVKARPGASKSFVVEVMSDKTIKINIAAAPEKGKANTALIKFLAKEMGVHKSDISIISGQGERVKLIKIVGALNSIKNDK
jgi:uncharacterized protein